MYIGNYHQPYDYMHVCPKYNSIYGRHRYMRAPSVLMGMVENNTLLIRNKNCHLHNSNYHKGAPLTLHLGATNRFSQDDIPDKYVTDRQLFRVVIAQVHVLDR